jgi:Dolichyl-phosphate-mannose-protein mannosyltransferase
LLSKEEPQSMKTPSESSWVLRRGEWFGGIVTVLIFLRYFAEMVRYCRSQPLWLDEILTMWLVRLGSAGRIYEGLAKGGQYSPPGYPVLLLWWSKVGGASYLSLRSPSFVGIALAAFAIFLLVRRYMDFSVATLAAVLVLSGPLHVLGQQMRPYALTVTCFAFALLLWDGLEHTEHRRWSLAGIVLLLSAAINLHFYSILYLVPFAAMELMYGLSLRRFRAPVWISLGIAGASISMWISLARRAGRFNSEDSGPEFYAAPTFLRFAQSLRIAVLPSDLFSRNLLLLLLLALLTVLLLYLSGVGDRSVRTPRRSRRPLLWIAIGCALLPLTTFAFARFVSGTYNLRYILPASICTVLLLCFVAERLPFRSILLPLCSIAIAAHALVPRWVAPFVDNRAIVQAASKPYPIVMAEGLMFFQAEEDQSLTGQERSRMEYLMLPQGYPLEDATNENLVRRWLGILPQLPAYPVQPYMQAGRCFYLFDSHESADDLSLYLKARGLIETGRTTLGQGMLSEICPAVKSRD